MLTGEDIWLSRYGFRYCYRVLLHRAPEFEPTLFVSGAFQTMDSWARFARAFAPLTTVILIDTPGMGQSDLLPAEYAIDFLADCIEQVLDEQGFNRVNIVAASYGTPTAYRIAQLYPNRVGRIVLAGTMKEIPGRIRDKVEASIDTALQGDGVLLAEQVIDGLLCRDLLKTIDRRNLAERILRSNLTRMPDNELQQYAANTTRLLRHEPLDLRLTPRGPEALVFTGEHDCFTTPEDCLEVAKAFERARFTTVRRADHLFHIEQFDVVVNILLRFMAGDLGQTVPGCNSVVEVGHLSDAFSLEPSASSVPGDATASDGGRTEGRYPMGIPSTNWCAIRSSGLRIDASGKSYSSTSSQSRHGPNREGPRVRACMPSRWAD